MVADLKTLKDLEPCQDTREIWKGHRCFENTIDQIKAEAIKWVKELKKQLQEGEGVLGDKERHEESLKFGIINWITIFFNITEKEISDDK